MGNLKKINETRKKELERIVQTKPKSTDGLGKLSLMDMKQTGYPRDGFSKEEWIRPVNFKLFPDNGPHYEDIYQMGSEDCWLLSMISALVVHHPEHFTKMVRETESGLYEVDFYSKGKKETVTVDSFFPKTKFAKPATVFWPLIIEKAMASYFNDNTDAYDVLESGNGKES